MPNRPLRSRRDSEQIGKRRENRPNAHRRGYGRKWQEYSRSYLDRHPLCAHCYAAGRITASECVDHIQAIHGPSDPLFWKSSNHQPLCWKCHGRKTVADNRK
ncbi:MAG: HNH endonuclease [Planctomyces sp.]|nr:HNH endonuclease [Planctomyces sp.]